MLSSGCLIVCVLWVGLASDVPSRGQLDVSVLCGARQVVRCVAGGGAGPKAAAGCSAEHWCAPVQDASWPGSPVLFLIS